MEIQTINPFSGAIVWINTDDYSIDHVANLLTDEELYQCEAITDEEWWGNLVNMVGADQIGSLTIGSWETLAQKETPAIKLKEAGYVMEFPKYFPVDACAGWPQKETLTAQSISVKHSCILNEKETEI